MSYDQWKTATPYDDEIDYSEYCAKCPKCGCEQYYINGIEEKYANLECQDCGKEYVFMFPAELIPDDGYDFGFEDFILDDMRNPLDNVAYDDIKKDDDYLQLCDY